MNGIPAPTTQTPLWYQSAHCCICTPDPGIQMSSPCRYSLVLFGKHPDHAASSQWQPTVIPEPTIQCGLRQGSGHCWSTDERYPTSLGRTGEGVWGTPRAIGRALFQAEGCLTPYPNYRLDTWCGSLNKIPQRP